MFRRETEIVGKVETQRTRNEENVRTNKFKGDGKVLGEVGQQLQVTEERVAPEWNGLHDYE